MEDVTHDDLCGCGEFAEDCAYGYGLSPEVYEMDPLEEIQRLECERAAYYDAVDALQAQIRAAKVAA